MKNGSKKGWILAPFILFILFITSIPSILAIRWTPPGGKWTGILSRNTGDLNGYLSIIEEIRSDGLMAHNLMTAEPHPPFQIRPFHAFLAFLGKLIPGLSPVALLEIGRLIASSVFLTLIALLVIQLYESTKDRIFAFFLIITASGLGWAHLTQDPPDLRYVELSTFLALVSPPLYQVSLSCVVGIILLLAAAFRTSSIKRQIFFSMIATLLAILLGFERPFPLIPLGLTIIGLLLFEMKKNKTGRIKLLMIVLPVAIGAGATIAIQMYLMQKIPVYAEWNRQHIVSSPPILVILLCLGFMLPLALYGIPYLWRKQREYTLIFCLYAISSMICSKLPIQIQERFLEGLPLSTAVLASAGVVRVCQSMKRTAHQTLAAMIILALLIPSTILGVQSDLILLARQSPPQYVPIAFLDGIESLEKLSKPGEPVLSLEFAGNFIIAYATRPTVLAHRVATSRLGEKKKLVTELLETPVQHPSAKSLMERTTAKWLFWGPEERDFAKGGFDPDDAPYLIRVYRNKLVAIYRIQTKY